MNYINKPLICIIKKVLNWLIKMERRVNEKQNSKS